MHSTYTYHYTTHRAQHGITHTTQHDTTQHIWHNKAHRKQHNDDIYITTQHPQHITHTQTHTQTALVLHSSQHNLRHWAPNEHVKQWNSDHLTMTMLWYVQCLCASFCVWGRMFPAHVLHHLWLLSSDLLDWTKAQHLSNIREKIARLQLQKDKSNQTNIFTFICCTLHLRCRPCSKAIIHPFPLLVVNSLVFTWVPQFWNWYYASSENAPN